MDNLIHTNPNEANINLLEFNPNQNVNIGATPSFSNVYLTNVPLDSTQTDIVTIDSSGILGYRVLPDFAALPANSVLSTNGAGEVVGTALTNGEIMIGSTSAAPVAATLTGTSNEVIVTNSTGSITLSLPQAIATTSTPTFGGLSIVSAAQPSLLINNGTDQFNSSLITSTAQVFSNSLTGDGAIFTTGGTGRILIGPEPGSPGSSPLEITSTFAEFFVPLSTTGVAANEIVTSNSAGTYTGIALSNGELLIGSNSAAPVAATLTQGANIAITNSAGAITVATQEVITIDNLLFTTSTGQIEFNTNTSNITTFNVPAGTGSQVLTFPNTTDTMVGRITTDTLQNKTISTTNNTLEVGATNLTSIISATNPLLTTSSPTFANVTATTLATAPTYYVGTPAATTLTNALVFPSATQTRKIVLFQGFDNDFSCYSLGIANGTLMYNLPNSTASHIFYAGNASSGSSTSNTEILQIYGSGNGTRLYSVQTANPTTYQIVNAAVNQSVNMVMTTANGQTFTSSSTGDGCIQVTSTSNSLRLGVGNASTAQVVITNTTVTLNETLVLNDIANDNTQGNFVMWNNSTGATIYRTLASLPIPGSGSSPTFQNLILQGTTNTNISMATYGQIAIDSSGGYYFTNTIANDFVVKNINSANNLALGVGSGKSQLLITNDYTTNNTYIEGGLTCTIAAQTAAGTGASASIVNSSQTGGIFSITAGSLGTPTTGNVAIITLPLATPYSPYGVIITPQSSGSALLSTPAYASYIDNLHWGVYATTALLGTATYTWNWSLAL